MQERLILFLLLFTTITFSQNQDSKFSIAVNYGPAYNFTLDYGRAVNKQDGYFIPPQEVFGYKLFQKNKVGAIAGLQFGYTFNKKNQLTLGYTREVHYGKYKGTIFLESGSPIFVNDIKLRDLNEFFELNYKRAFGRAQNFYLTGGLYILNLNRSEVIIAENSVEIRERNNANSNLQEGGFSVGLEHYFYSSGRFQFGATSKIYFTASTGEFETFAITPVLKYNF